MTDRALPTVTDIIGPSIDELVAVRPTVETHLDNGHWGDILVGQRGQIGAIRTRLQSEIAAARLPSSENGALTALAHSEFDTVRLDTPVKAIGEIGLLRKVIHYAYAPLNDFNAIVVADATDAASILQLAANIKAILNGHAFYVYDPATGLGPHVAMTVPSSVVLAFGNMQQTVDVVNQLKVDMNGHFANTTAHLDADTASTVTIPDAFASAGLDTFANNSLAAQNSVLRLVNGLKKAFNKHAQIIATPGVIFSGTKWTLQADDGVDPPVAGGQYISLSDAAVSAGDQRVLIPVEAVKAGASSNIPVWSDGGPTLVVNLSGSVYDSAFSTETIAAAGGSDGQLDPELRTASRARFTGRYGPTLGALQAGVLAGGNVSHSVILEDLDHGWSYVYATDASWAQSQALQNSTKQILQDQWLGSGCRVRSGTVQNRKIRVEANIQVRSPKDLSDTSSIYVNIQTALRSYFDDRPDWYVWRLSSIRGVCARADRRIVNCNLVLVRDESGVVLQEPSQPVAGDVLIHWVFSGNALTPIFSIPE